jgi:hypothetical protein
VIELVEITDEILLLEWVIRFLILSISSSELVIEAVPLFVIVFAIILILLHSILLLLASVHSKSFFESKRINLLKDSFESNERLLKNLMPMLLSKLCNDRDKHREGLLLVGLKDVEEVVIFKEAHSSVSNLKMDTPNAFNNSFEEAGNKVLNLIYFTNF